MRLSLHGVIALFALTITALGLAVTHTNVIHRFGLDVWTLPQDEAALYAQQERERKLDKQSEVVSRRFSLKNNIIQEVIDDRISVADAAQQFNALNQVEPQINTMTLSTFSANSAEEATLLQVVRFVKTELQTQPAKARDVIKRLGAEIKLLTGRRLVQSGEIIRLADERDQ